jgi:hypothetical protein
MMWHSFNHFMPVPAESRADLPILLKGQLNEECSKPVGTKGSGGELGGYGHIAPSIGKSQKNVLGFSLKIKRGISQQTP